METNKKNKKLMPGNQHSGLIFILCLITVPFVSRCQKLPTERNRIIDSLRLHLRTAESDSSKIKYLNALGWQLRTGNPDTAILLSNEALIMSKKMFSSSSNLLIKKGREALSNTFGNLGIYYFIKAEYQTALDYDVKALNLNEQMLTFAVKDSEKKIAMKGIASRLSNIGLVYNEQGNYPKALEHQLEACQIAIKIGDKKLEGSCLGNTGIIYKEQDDLPKALEYYKKALKINEDLKDKKGIGTWLGNIANVYFELNEFDKALDYYFRALKIREEIGAKNLIATCLGNIGLVYKNQFKYDKALEYYFLALEIDNKIGNKNGVSRHYANIGVLYLNIGKFKESFTYLNLSLAINDSIGASDAIKANYDNLSYLYAQSTVPLPDSIGGKFLNFEKMRLRALYYHKRYISIRDTLFSEENKKQLVRKEMNFEFEKKEAATKAEQEKKNAIQEAESKKQKIIMLSVVGCLLLVICFAGFIFRSLRITRKQKTLIEHQKHLVEEKQKEILDSIYYARRIQRALITNENYIAKNLIRLNNKNAK